MKVSNLVSTVALTFAILAPVASMAADDNSGTKMEMAPHSHTQEKGYGAPAKKKATDNKAASDQATDNTEKSAKPNAANDRSKHYHPRDGK